MAACFNSRTVQTKEELFNLRHAQLRNVIERIFGVMKKRFPILVHVRQYSLPVQVDIVYACTALHNFLGKHSGEDAVYVDWDNDFRAEQMSVRYRARRGRDGTVHVDEEEEPVTTNVTQEQRERGQQMRDAIARRMWRAYCRRTAADRRVERAEIANRGFENQNAHA